jgi:hypothetical protein
MTSGESVGVVGFEPTYSEEEGFTVGFPSTHWRKQEYIGTIQSMVYQGIDCAAVRHFTPVLSCQVRKICVNGDELSLYIPFNSLDEHSYRLHLFDHIPPIYIQLQRSLRNILDYIQISAIKKMTSIASYTIFIHA